MIKLISITWSYEDLSFYRNSFLYNSFIRYNNPKKFINIHFNRNNYLELEKQKQTLFDYQYEYIIYKIILLKEKIKNIEADYLIYADDTDVVCLSEIDEILNFLSDDSVIFSAESHQYPRLNAEWNTYPVYNQKNNLYLNSGLYAGTKKNIIKMIDQTFNVLNLHYKNFGGDQGVYTHLYLNDQSNIKLDVNNSVFLSTYLKSTYNFIYQNNRLIDNIHNTTPLFVHDNGWNYGSPRFIESFNLV